MVEQRTWRTADKRVLNISEMSDEHVVNTIKMLKRNGFCTLASWEACSSGLAGLRGDMALYYAEQEMANAKPCHELDWLLDEAKKRGLSYG